MYILFIVSGFLVLIFRFVGFTNGEAFGLILDFTGAIAGSLTSFVIPALLYLKLNSKSAPYYNQAILLFIFGGLVMILCPILSISLTLK